MLTASYINRLCQFGREEYDLCIFDDSGVEIRRFSTAYNGSQPRLVVKANPAAGILADTVIATASGAAES